MEGDTGKCDLGLSPENRKLIIESTHVVFHGAATVRFDEKIRQAVNINVRGLKLMLQLAKEMKNLKVCSWKYFFYFFYFYFSKMFSKIMLIDSI